MKSSIIFNSILCVFAAFIPDLDGIRADEAGSSLSYHSYQVRVPAGTLSCEEEASALSHRFFEATSILPKSARCKAQVQIAADDEKYSLYTLELEYPARIQLQTKLTSFGHTGTFSIDASGTGDYYGFYPSYSKCLNDLGTRSAEFEKFTQSKAVAAYCMPGRVNFDSYVLKIEAFAKSIEQLYSMDADLPFDLNSDLLEKIENIVTAGGGNIVGSQGSRFFFYRDQPFAFHAERLITYQNRELCLSQIPASENIFKNLKASWFSVQCVPSPIEEKWDLHAVWFGGKMFYSDSVLTRYLSFEECSLDIDRQMKDAASPWMNRVIYGAICKEEISSISAESFVMKIFRSL